MSWNLTSKNPCPNHFKIGWVEDLFSVRKLRGKTRNLSWEPWLRLLYWRTWLRRLGAVPDECRLISFCYQLYTSGGVSVCWSPTYGELITGGGRHDQISVNGSPQILTSGIWSLYVCVFQSYGSVFYLLILMLCNKQFQMFEMVWCEPYFAQCIS